MPTHISNKWNHILDKYFATIGDVYFTEEYVKLYETDTIKAQCFIYEEGSNAYLFPFLLEPVNIQPEYFDLETPYGYGGPISSTSNKEFISKAVSELIGSLKHRKVIAAFFRFHPLIGNHELLGTETKILPDRKTVSIDLNPDINEIWKTQIHSKHRNAIRKSQKEGLVYEVDQDLKNINEFKRIYGETMKKVGASDFYFFSNEYYDKVLSCLKSHTFLAYAKYSGKIISASLFFTYNSFSHYHISGSDVNYLHLNPNGFLLFETMKYLKTMGVSMFHLGGGSDSTPNNSLFKFKNRFSKNQHQFYIGKMLINPHVYNQVCKIWETKHDEETCLKFKNIFLKYKL